ncbi:MAG: tetratricopeptide repeat protein [Saprospiraceae bacterium]|nr:MAG: tetratricopeptide repeat protein [Bacteroidetes bacterium OLB9]MCO6463618.1 tetratricopeptide repeat protein [Saprospiraceae bacterium]MCZ2339067.1 tetratricopeptide repeat protein [Chitinophagales bacterium]
MKIVLKLVVGILLFSGIQGIAQTDLAPGIRMIENENYGEATAYFEKISKEEPKEGLPIYYLAKIKYKLEEYQAAAALFDQAVKVDKKCVLCTIGQGQMLLEDGKTEEAEKKLSYISLRNKKSAAVQAAIGDVYLYSRKPDYKMAIEYLTKARDIDPSIGAYWAHLGDAFDADNQAGNAMNAYETAVKKDNKNVEAYISMAKIWRATDNRDLAISNLLQAVKLAPDYAPAYKTLYETYMRFGMNDKVLPILEKYVSLAGTDELAKIRLLRFMVTEARDYDRAIELGDELKRTSSDYSINRWLAYAYANKEEFEKANEYMMQLDSSIASGTGEQYDADIYYKGVIAMGLKDYDKALGYYHQMWKKDSTGRDEVLGNLAKKFYDEKDYENAIRFYKEKAKYHDLQVIEQYLLAGSFYAKKDYEASLLEFKKLTEISPNYAMAWYNIAKCVEKRDPDHLTYPAMENFKNFLTVIDETPMEQRTPYINYIIDAYMYLGYGYVNADDNKLAKEAFEKVLVYNPEHAKAKEYVELLSK